MNIMEAKKKLEAIVTLLEEETPIAKKAVGFDQKNPFHDPFYELVLASELIKNKPEENGQGRPNGFTEFSPEARYLAHGIPVVIENQGKKVVYSNIWSVDAGKDIPGKGTAEDGTATAWKQLKAPDEAGKDKNDKEIIAAPLSSRQQELLNYAYELILEINQLQLQEEIQSSAGNLNKNLTLFSPVPPSTKNETEIQENQYHRHIP